MKFKVKEDVSVSNQFGPDTEFKAGVHEAKDSNRAQLEYLESIGLADRVKTADKEA